MTDLVRKALAVHQTRLALGHETFEAEGAVFVRNRAVPGVWAANHAGRVTAATPEAIDRLLARAEAEYAGFGHRRFDVDFTTPPQFEARLALDGYACNETLVMLLEGDLLGQAPAHDIRPVTDPANREAFGELNGLGWREYIEGTGRPYEAGMADQILCSDRAKAPPVRHWLAYLEGRPAAYFTSWEGTEGAGQVEDLFTLPDCRHRALATALLHHCVADCRAHGAGPIVIVCDPGGTPKEMYAAMGWRPLAMKRNYLKHLAQPAAPAGDA